MNRKLKSGTVLRGLALSLACACAAISANAVTSAYFDVNGTTTGSGVANGSSYTWEGNNWDLTQAGTGASVAWVDGEFPRFNAGVPPDGTGASYTVNCSANHTIAGAFMTFTSPNGPTQVTVNGPGILSITAGQQGFFVTSSTQTLMINAVLAGVGGVQNSSPGSLDLYGVNTYTGGTLFNAAGGLNINNNSSFGTGPVAWGVAQQVLADLTATTPLTIANTMGTRAASQLIISTPAAAPITFTGNWTNAAGISRLTMNTAATKVTIASKMFGATGNLLIDGPGTLVITGTNANNVTTTVGPTNGNLEIGVSGSLSGTVVVTNTLAFLPTLKLDATNNLTLSAKLALSSSLPNGTVNLNFTGSNTIFAITIDGVAQPTGSWGPPGSGADNQNAIFTGTGFLNVLATPVIVTQPVGTNVLAGANVTLSVNATGGQPLFFQWNTNGVPISGATLSSYNLLSAAVTDAGNYSVTVSNSAGTSNSVTVVLTVGNTNTYTAAVTGDFPAAYWRLDETSGTVAHDVISNNFGVFSNVTLNQPGYSLVDTDTCIGLPTSSASRGFVQITNSAPFNYNGVTKAFSLECWAYFTNFSGVQRMFSTLANVSPAGWAFGINGSTGLRFTTGGNQDADLTLNGGNVLLAKSWTHLVVTCDGLNYSFYVNGNPVGSAAITGTGSGVSPTVPLQFGANPAGYPTSEQVQGNLDEVAIYQYTLAASQVLAHYQASFGPLAAPINPAPIVTPATNYVSLSTSIKSQAVGQLLSYQWFKAPSTLLVGQTTDTLTFPSLALTDAGSYFVQASNPIAATNSPSVALAVLPIPTSATDLNLTNALVLHLPFDGDYKDISGRNNNGTNEGATTFVAPGAIGGSALHYSSDSSIPSFNYVSLGVPADLQFGSNINFSVSYWIRETNGVIMTNLPFFTDVPASAQGVAGFTFSPFEDTNGNGGGWKWSVGTTTSPNAATHFNDFNTINDGNWHSLIHVADRTANLITYLDGVLVDQQSIVIDTNLTTNTSVSIGQDSTGAYAVTGAADIDDLGVWKRKLTSLEVSGIYLAGVSNSVSFAPVVVGNTTNFVTLTIQQVGATTQITWPGGAGNLTASTNVTGPYTNVPTAASPYTIPTPLSTQMFYKLHP